MGCCLAAGQTMGASVLETARQIGGYSKGKDAPVWDSMSEEGRMYVGPMAAQPSPLFCVPDDYPRDIRQESDLWQLIWAMHKELKTEYVFAPGNVEQSPRLKDWINRINTLKTLQIRAIQTVRDAKQVVVFQIGYGSDMRIFAAFRNPKLIKVLTKKEKDVLDVCSQWISDNIRKDMPNFLKIKKIHDGIVENTTYTRPYHFTPELVLEGIGVCSAYTTACQLLLHMVKIDCRYAHGEVSTTKTETHAWNMVDVNGEWYHMDSTWDDPSNNLCYTYFLINDEEMDIDHDWPLKGSDDIYPTTPEINKLKFHIRRDFSYTDGQRRKEEDFYVDEHDESIYEKLFGMLPEEDADRVQKFVPKKQLGQAVQSMKKTEKKVNRLLGKETEPEEEKKQDNEIRTKDEFNKFIRQRAEKLAGPKFSFKMAGGCTESARCMVNASDIHKYVKAYSLTSSEEHPSKEDPIITLTVEYWPHVRMESAIKDKDAAACLTAEESAVLYACRKLVEEHGTTWKLERQKLRDVYQYFTTRVKFTDNEMPATDAVLKSVSSSLGYATTLHVLCTLMEMPCRVVQGRTADKLHTWNLIRRTGKLWFHADAAMDAAEGNWREYRWKYFRDSDEEALDNRVWYLEEHPATPPLKSLKKTKMRELLQKLRQYTGVPVQ